MDFQTVKSQLGVHALRFIRPGMTVGLGTGSTATCFIEALGNAYERGLRVEVVASSDRSFSLAKKLQIPVRSLEEVSSVDVTVDGADEVAPNKEMIKGAGGAHVREKILAHFSKSLVILIDESKLVRVLGEKCPLPVETVSFGLQASKQALETLSPLVQRRHTKKGDVWETDNGGAIFDLKMPHISPCALHAKILEIPGVVDTGYFPDRGQEIVVGKQDGSICRLEEISTEF